MIEVEGAFFIMSTDQTSNKSARFQTKLIVISGPSGVGKSSVVQRLVEACPQAIELSVSATTRAPRPGERDGVDYRFLSHARFEAHRQQGDFLEVAEVFGRGDWYGTLRQPVVAALAEQKHVVLEIDVDGARQVLEQYSEALSIFIHPGSLDELERRLRGRKTESEAAIQRRLEVARRELEQADKYRHVIVNQEIPKTVEKICQLIQQEA